jgi:predicted PurR-regulated permease PerM
MAEASPVDAHFTSMRPPSGPFWITVLLGIVATLVFIWSAAALFVFGVGVAIAFFLVPVVNWLERRGLARWISAILAVVTTLIVSVLLVGAIALIIVQQGLDFVATLPELLAELDDWYASLDLPDWLRAGIDSILLSVEDNLAALDQGIIVAGIIGGFANLIGGLFAWLLLPFFLFYLLKDQPKMAANFYDRVPAPWKDDVSHVLTVSVGNFAQYFKAEFVVGSIMFFIVTLGMIAIGVFLDAPLLVDFALLLGLIAFVMELIPQIGPILSYIPALLLAIPAGFDAVAWVSVYYFIIFNIEGSVLVPNLEGKMISFTGASVLVLIAIGFALGGIIGAILALPLASIVRDLFRHFFDKAVADSLVYEPVEAPGDGSAA